MSVAAPTAEDTPVVPNNDNIEPPEGEPPSKKRRFETSYAADSEWEIPQDMADYFSKQFNNFIKPSELQDFIKLLNCLEKTL